MNSGEVELSKFYKDNVSNARVKVRISMCTQGCIFGMEEILSHKPRNLTAICHSRDTEIFSLAKQIYLQAI